MPETHRKRLALVGVLIVVATAILFIEDPFALRAGVPSAAGSAPTSPQDVPTLAQRPAVLRGQGELAFVALGASLGALTDQLLLSQAWLSRIGGAVIIFFGLVTLDLVRLPILDQERRLPLPSVAKVPVLGAVLVGAAFAVGWTPCVGPILGSVLALAGSTASAGSGAALLFSYSLGLMIPFLLLGLFSDNAARVFARLGPLLRFSGPVVGMIQLVVGVAVFTNTFTQVAGQFVVGVPSGLPLP